MSSGIEYVPEHTPITTTALEQDASYKRKAPYSEVDEKKTRSFSSVNSQNKRPVDPVINGETNVLVAKEEEEIEEEGAKRANLWRKVRPFALIGLALLILSWWISATILSATRNRWYVPLPWQTHT
jgi:CNT family concentrative nucleoside transporter